MGSPELFCRRAAPIGFLVPSGAAGNTAFVHIDAGLALRRRLPFPAARCSCTRAPFSGSYTQSRNFFSAPQSDRFEILTRVRRAGWAGVLTETVPPLARERTK